MTLDGGAGADSLDGGLGDDALFGSAGADTLLAAMATMFSRPALTAMRTSSMAASERILSITPLRPQG